MFFRLLAAFICVPLVEFMLLMRLSLATNLLTTIVIVVGTGILGSWLARREGIVAWTRFQQALGEGRAPSREIQDGLMIVFAAALLLTPGLLTDAFGFLLLSPPGRALIRKYVLGRYLKGLNVNVVGGAFNGTGNPSNPAAKRNDPNTIDATAVHRSENS